MEKEIPIQNDMKAESAISDYKRIFGESVSSKTLENMINEFLRNTECFNIMKS